MSKELKPRDQEFVKEYLSNGNNAKQAAKKTRPYLTDKSAEVTGHNILRTIKGKTDLLEKYLPDTLLFKKHKELLDKTEDGAPETQAVSKALDMAYKLKGNYAPEKKELSGSLEVVADPVLEALSQQLDALDS